MILAPDLFFRKHEVHIFMKKSYVVQLTGQFALRELCWIIFWIFNLPFVSLQALCLAFYQSPVIRMVVLSRQVDILQTFVVESTFQVNC